MFLMCDLKYSNKCFGICFLNRHHTRCSRENKIGIWTTWLLMKLPMKHTVVLLAPCPMISCHSLVDHVHSSCQVRLSSACVGDKWNLKYVAYINIVTAVMATSEIHNNKYTHSIHHHHLMTGIGLLFNLSGIFYSSFNDFMYTEDNNFGWNMIRCIMLKLMFWWFRRNELNAI